MDWEDACNVVLGRKLCVWKELLQPLLLARAKVWLFTVSVNITLNQFVVHIERTSNNRICFILILFLIVTFITLSLLYCVGYTGGKIL